MYLLKKEKKSGRKNQKVEKADNRKKKKQDGYQRMIIMKR